VTECQLLFESKRQPPSVSLDSLLNPFTVRVLARSWTLRDRGKAIAAALSGGVVPEDAVEPGASARLALRRYSTGLDECRHHPSRRTDEQPRSEAWDETRRDRSRRDSAAGPVGHIGGRAGGRLSLHGHRLAAVGHDDQSIATSVCRRCRLSTTLRCCWSTIKYSCSQRDIRPPHPHLFLPATRWPDNRSLNIVKQRLLYVLVARSTRLRFSGTLRGLRRQS